MTVPIILGMMQAKAMEYVKFPQIEQPHAFKICTTTLKKHFKDKTHPPKTVSNSKCAHTVDTIPKTICGQKCESSKATQAKQSRQTDEPVVPKIKWNGKVHRLPVTKDIYVLKEYSDVIKGVGTLPGSIIHITLYSKDTTNQSNTLQGQYQSLCKKG